jgi:DNA polymerase III epsilon subunit family exonuclease
MPFSLLQPLHEIPIAVVDVETTGASADFGDSVIELGIVRIERGQKVAEYQQLLDPQRRIGPGITALTGITQAMVTGQPRFVDELPRVTELLSGAAILGHNVRFDLSFLNKEFRRCGREMPGVLGPRVPVLDTVRVARRRFGRGGNGLGRLARRLGIEPAIAHRALADAQTTHLVFEKLLEPIGGWGTCLCDVMREQGGPMGLLPTNPRESPLPLALEEALEQRKPVLMEYLDARDQRTHRVIEPLKIRRFRGELLLVAHCQLRNDRRTFKLERVVELTRIDDTLAPSPGTPGEGRGGGDFDRLSLFAIPNHPHPNPPPVYRERENEEEPERAADDNAIISADAQSPADRATTA